MLLDPEVSGRDVVLEPVGLWTAGQDRCLLGRRGLLPKSQRSGQTGWTDQCFALFFGISPNDSTYEEAEVHVVSVTLRV